MRLGSEVNNAVNMLFLHEGIDSVEVAYIRTDKTVVGTVLNILEVGKVAGISKFIDVDDTIVGILIDKKPYHMTPYKSGTAGDDDIHNFTELD